MNDIEQARQRLYDIEKKMTPRHFQSLARLYLKADPFTKEFINEHINFFVYRGIHTGSYLVYQMKDRTSNYLMALEPEKYNSSYIEVTEDLFPFPLDNLPLKSLYLSEEVLKKWRFRVIPVYAVEDQTYTDLQDILTHFDIEKAVVDPKGDIYFESEVGNYRYQMGQLELISFYTIQNLSVKAWEYMTHLLNKSQEKMGRLKYESYKDAPCLETLHAAALRYKGSVPIESLVELAARSYPNCDKRFREIFF